MVNQDDQFKKVISHAKEYGYIFQSSEIYDGLSAVYDYAVDARAQVAEALFWGVSRSRDLSRSAQDEAISAISTCAAALTR